MFKDGGEGGGKGRRGLGPRNDVLATCKAVNPRASQRPSKAAVCFLMIFNFGFVNKQYNGSLSLFRYTFPTMFKFWSVVSCGVKKLAYVLADKYFFFFLPRTLILI